MLRKLHLTYFVTFPVQLCQLFLDKNIYKYTFVIGFPSDGIVQPEEEEELESDDEDVSPSQEGTSRSNRRLRSFPKGPGMRPRSEEGTNFRYNYWAKEPRGRQMNNTKSSRSRPREV